MGIGEFRDASGHGIYGEDLSIYDYNGVVGMAWLQNSKEYEARCQYTDCIHNLRAAVDRTCTASRAIGQPDVEKRRIETSWEEWCENRGNLNSNMHDEILLRARNAETDLIPNSARNPHKNRSACCMYTSHGHIHSAVVGLAWRDADVWCNVVVKTSVVELRAKLLVYPLCSIAYIGDAASLL